MRTQASGERVLTLLEDDLLVFVDETGHESLNSSGGIFGLGGIIVYGIDYGQLADSWRALRRQIGLPDDQPLHAADQSEYKGHENEIGDFFRQRVFVRLASMVTTETVSDQSPFVTAAMGLFRSVGQVLASVRQTAPVRRVHYVVEHAQRLEAAYRRLYGDKGPVLVDAAGNRTQTSHEWDMPPKSACVPGLEISDFALHAAQGQLKATRKNPKAPVRADFECVFEKVAHPELSKYLVCTKLTSEETEGPQGLFRLSLR